MAAIYWIHAQLRVGFDYDMRAEQVRTLMLDTWAATH